MTSDANPDDRVLEDLRALFAHDDPVPPLVVETAKASLGWRRLDADLAELLSDSALESAAQPALARGGQAALRSVSFAAGRLTIDLEILAEGPGHRVLGQLSPAAAARIEVQVATGDGAESLSLQADALGRFRAAIPAGARAIRLRVGGAEAPTETSWVPL